MKLAGLNPALAYGMGGGGGVTAKEQGQSSVFQLEPSTVLSSHTVSTTVPDTFVAINCAVKLPTLPAV